MSPARAPTERVSRLGTALFVLVVSLFLVTCGDGQQAGESPGPIRPTDPTRSTGPTPPTGQTSGVVVFNGGDVRPLATAPRSTPKEAWRVRGVAASPSSAGEMLFMTVSDGGDWRLVRLDPRSGKALWTASLNPANDGPARIALVNGTLVVSAGEEEAAVLGLDPESGDRRWQLRGGLNTIGRTHIAILDLEMSVVEAGSGKMTMREPGSAARFSVDDDTVYVGSERSLVAKSLNGAERWRIEASLRSMLVIGETVIFSDQGAGSARLRAVGAKDGRERWSRVDEPFVNLLPTPDGRLVTMSRKGAELLAPADGTALGALPATASGGWLIKDGATELLVVSEPGVQSGAGSTATISIVDLAKPTAVAWRAAASAPDPSCLGVQGLVLTTEPLPPEPPVQNSGAGLTGEKRRIVAHRLTDGEAQWEVSGAYQACAAAEGTLVLKEGDSLVGFR